MTICDGVKVLALVEGVVLFFMTMAIMDLVGCYNYVKGKLEVMEGKREAKTSR